MLTLLLFACVEDPPKSPADTGAETGWTEPGDLDGDGYDFDDCAPHDPEVNPAAPERCNGVDDNCDGQRDEGVTFAWHADADLDGYGALDVAGEGCEVPTGYLEDGSDCADLAPDVHPDAAEVCDGVDQDCDGEVDDGVTVVVYADVDGDGHGDPSAAVSACADGDGVSELGDDCDDADAGVHPGATEACGGGDEDCDGVVDGDALEGSAAACAAESCLAVHNYRPDAPDGTYWIDLDGVPTELVCDMTRDDGGWTLVANFVWPGTTGGVAGWTSGAAVGATTTDRTQSFKVADTDINALVRFRYRARGTATMCTQDDRSVSACTVDTTLYWASTCVYASGSTSTGDCTAAYQTYDLDGWTELSNPCSWHYGLTSADCGVTSEFGTSHEGDHVFAGIVGTYTHAYDGRTGEDPSVEVWVR